MQMNNFPQTNGQAVPCRASASSLNSQSEQFQVDSESTSEQIGYDVSWLSMDERHLLSSSSNLSSMILANGAECRMLAVDGCHGRNSVCSH